MEKLEASADDRERIASLVRLMKDERRVVAEIAAAVRADDPERFKRAFAELSKAREPAPAKKDARPPP